MAGFFQAAREEGMERGIEQGREEGREEGRVEGERAVLERLLVCRFGRLPPATAERLGRATGATLRRGWRTCSTRRRSRKCSTGLPEPGRSARCSAGVPEPRESPSFPRPAHLESRIC